MSARILDLDALRRRRKRPHSIEIDPCQLARFASPGGRHRLAVMLDAPEFEFMPQATLIERLRYSHSVDELQEILRITLERAQ